MAQPSRSTASPSRSSSVPDPDQRADALQSAARRRDRSRSDGKLNRPDGEVSNTVAVTVPSTPVPGVYINGSNHAAAQNYPSYDTNSSTDAAAAGSVVIVYFNGGGPVTGESSLTTGKATPNSIFPVTASYSATIGALPATVEFVGLSPGFAGLYQANIVIPQIAAGSHPLVLTVGGVASNSTTISTK